MLNLFSYVQWSVEKNLEYNFRPKIFSSAGGVTRWILISKLKAKIVQTFFINDLGICLCMWGEEELKYSNST